MHRTWMGVTGIAVAFAAACGQGRVIFNVDAYSFLAGSGTGTVPYAAPPATSIDTSTVQKVSLPGGLGSSLVDTVKVTGSVDFRNDSGGPGTITFQVYLAKDSAGAFAASADSILTPPISASLSGASTTSVPINANNLSPKGDSLFTGSQVWFRVRARVSNSGTFLHGKAALTALQLRVVVQDKVF
jgi:hypothetical protein